MDLLRDWISIANEHPGWSELLLGIALLLVLILRAGLRRTRFGRRLDSSFTLMALGVIAAMLAGLAAAAGSMSVYLYLDAFSIAAAAIGSVRVVLVLLVDFHLRERRGAAVSTIIRDVGSVLVYFLIILAVLRFTLDINLASLVATSAVLTAIVGLAFQDVLSSVINGLVLELEDPFHPSDWVHVGDFEGQVVETGWRTTRIRTRVNQFVTLPNTYMTREPVVNYSRPDPRHGDTLTFEAAYEAPPHAVKRAVLSVLAGEPAVLSHPAAEVRTTSYNESGIAYNVRYWIDDFGELERIRDRLMTNLWYALRRADVRIPFPARDLFIHSEAPESPLAIGDVAAALSRVPLFAPLRPEEIRTLGQQVRRILYGSGEAIVREGDAGESFYLIEHGTVDVLIGKANGRKGRSIAQLGPGEYFGEMSLLAGETRSATVMAREDVSVLEVGRGAFQEIVAADPSVLEPISQVATHRSEAQRAQRRAEDEMPPFERDPAAQRLLQRIRTFLGL